MNERKKERKGEYNIFAYFFLTFTCKLEEGGNNWGKLFLHFFIFSLCTLSDSSTR